MCTALLVSINKRKKKESQRGGVEEKKSRGNLRTYMELYIRIRARALIPARCSTKKGFFYDRSLFYICKNMQKIYPLSLTHLCASRSYVNIKRKMYILILYIRIIHICIYITFMRALSAYNIYVICVSSVRVWISHFHGKKKIIIITL